MRKRRITYLCVLERKRHCMGLKYQEMMKVVAWKRKGVQNLRVCVSLCERDDIHVEKCNTGIFMFLLFSVFSINKFSVNEIYHTLDSKIIFNSTLITISNSLYLSFYSIFLPYFFPLSLTIYQSSVVPLLLSVLLRYISRIFSILQHIYIGEEKWTYKWVRVLL